MESEGMITMILIAAVVFTTVGWFHFAVLSRTVPPVIDSNMSRAAQHTSLVALIGTLHAFEAFIYALVFRWSQSLGLGGFKPGEPLSLMDVYYFSLVNYTTLGLGDIYPSGHLRFLAGMESLGGFLLLSCSASYLFSVAQVHVKKGN